VGVASGDDVTAVGGAYVSLVNRKRTATRTMMMEMTIPVMDR